MVTAVEELLDRIRRAMEGSEIEFGVDAGYLVISEVCRECRGSGCVELLITRQACMRCSGAGVLSATIDLPLTESKVIRFCRSFAKKNVHQPVHHQRKNSCFRYNM